MSRLKIALGLVVIAVAATMIAIALRPSQPGRSEHTAVEQRQPAEPVAVQGKKPTVQSAQNDAILKNLVTSPGESRRSETNAPRMQSKQIKMH
jgi:hypothetical protein